MRQSKVGDPEIQEKAVKLVKEAGMPVSVEYIANNLDLAWATARGIMFELALRREIIAEKTTKSWIFTLVTNTDIPGVKPVSAPIALNSHPDSVVTNSMTDIQTKGDKNEPTNR